MKAIIPQPASIHIGQGIFNLTADTPITISPATAEVSAVAGYLAERLRPATGYPLPVRPAGDAPQQEALALILDPAADESDEGYSLRITSEGVTLTAGQAAGLFYAVQTLRQLLPPAIEATTPQPGPWLLPAVTILDAPRFAWRGLMLDVSRHFFSVADVKRVIDLAAAYKLNRLHLHLADDQGWRIEIKSWPELARVGGQTAVGGGPGGYYTQRDYAAIVAYATSRHVTVVPEIDLPGHTNAALSAYPELNPNGVAPPPYTGIEVGFSSLALDKEITYRFVEDVIGELAALTPGNYLHIGGDEAHATPKDDYIRFIERVQAIVGAHGKRMIGWEEIGQSQLSPTSVAQHWVGGYSPAAVQQGSQLILSPAAKVYLDMKYDDTTPLGLVWAGHISVQTSYDWDPATLIPDVDEAAVLGVEAALWAETLETIAQIDYMLFPRLPGVAEIGWSPAAARDWATYRERLAGHGPRWEVMGVNFHRSSGIAWR